jgi:hypothetical protein
MSNQIKVDRRRQKCSAKHENYKRRQRRKMAAARAIAKIEYMKGWADRVPIPQVWR